MKREAEASWAAERVENALLRERINDVAAEVAKLAVTAGRPELADRGNPGLIPSPGRCTCHAQGRQRSGAGRNHDGGDNERGSLADRMRALQSRASRLTSP